jgi:hypothetical protein
MAMNVSNACLSDIRVRFANRDYTVVHGRWPNGSAALLLKNVETDGLLLISRPYGRLPRDSNETFVADNRDLVNALEEAGVVRKTSRAYEVERDTVRMCRVVHPELLRCAQLRDCGNQQELSADREITRER